MQLLTQNEDLKKSGVYGWTLPAHWVTLTNGERFNTCPHAGICAAFCYAKTGRWQFSTVKKAHVAKLELVLEDLAKFVDMMDEELNRRKYQDKFIRIHDSGDFFSTDYAMAWFAIACQHHDKTFYAYTKEVRLFKGFQTDGLIPKNFIVIYSLGGRQDHLIDKDKDRHSDVFPSLESMAEAGYVDIGEDDRLAAISPNHRVGLYRNNIRHLVKKMGERKFSDWQTKRVDDIRH